MSKLRDILRQHNGAGNYGQYDFIPESAGAALDADNSARWIEQYGKEFLLSQKEFEENDPVMAGFFGHAPGSVSHDVALGNLVARLDAMEDMIGVYDYAETVYRAPTQAHCQLAAAMDSVATRTGFSPFVIGDVFREISGGVLDADILTGMSQSSEDKNKNAEDAAKKKGNLIVRMAKAVGAFFVGLFNKFTEGLSKLGAGAAAVKGFAVAAGDATLSALKWLETKNANATLAILEKLIGKYEASASKLNPAMADAETVKAEAEAATKEAEDAKSKVEAAVTEKKVTAAEAEASTTAAEAATKKGLSLIDRAKKLCAKVASFGEALARVTAAGTVAIIAIAVQAIIRGLRLVITLVGFILGQLSAMASKCISWLKSFKKEKAGEAGGETATA